MKTTRMIAGTALASLLVVGPLTMTQAHDFPSPGPLNKSLLKGAANPSVAATAQGDSLMNVDLRAKHLDADALAQAVETSTTRDGFEVKTVAGLTDYIVITTPDSSYSAVIQIDVHGRAHRVGGVYHEDGGKIILVLQPERPPMVLSGMGMEAGMDPSAVKDAAIATAVLYLASTPKE